jgi:hypothetical protein
MIQREADRGSKVDELIPFGIAISVAMPGVVEVYAQAQARLGIRPRPAVAGLLACAIAGMIFMEITQQISPD